MKTKTNETKTYVVPQTKGGAGKSVFSTMVLPYLLDIDIENIQIFEIDNNSTSRLTNTLVSFKTIKVNKAEDALDEVYLDTVLKDKNKVNIIDCGGGDETKIILRSLADAELEGLTYFVPIFDDIDYVQNAIDTIAEVRQNDKKAKVVLVFNMCDELEKSKVQEQFVGVFGDEEIGIPSRIDDIDFDETIFVPKNKYFGLVKAQYKITFIEAFRQAEELLRNKKQKELEYIKEGGRELLKKNLPMFKFAKRIVESGSTLNSCKSVLK